MFKKTLLALTVAGITQVATAGTIYTSVTESTGVVVGDFTVTPAAGEALGLGGLIGGVDDNCDVAATDLGVTLTGTAPNVASAGGNNDTITSATNVNGILSPAAVAMTGLGACTAKQADATSTAVVSSSLEFAQNGNVPVSATLVAGIGGYDVGDTITINLSGALVDTVVSTLPTLTSAELGVIINVLDITTTGVRFTVDATSAKISGKGILVLGGVFLDATGLSATTQVSVSAFATNTSGTQFDVTAGVKVADLVPQYSSAVSAKLDGVIDVSADRKSLAVNAADTTTAQAINNDTLTVTVSKDSTGSSITPATVEYAITGDFSWLDTSADTSADAVAATPAELATYLTAGFYVGTGDDTFLSATLSAAKDVLTVVTTAVSGNVDTVANFLFPVKGNVAGAPVLNETNFGVTVTAKDATAAPNTVSMAAGTTAAGAWTLNGSVVTVPYMPYGPNTKVIMRHTNTGVQTGDMTVRYMLEGISTDWVSVGVVGSSTRGVQNIRDLVMNAIMTDSGSTSGKVAVEITTNVPSDDVTVYAAYNVKNSADDRGFVGTFGKHGSAQ